MDRFTGMWFVLALFCAACYATNAKAETNIPFRLTTIVLDPGHGGKDPGNVGAGRIAEKDINLQISLRLAKLLSDKTEYAVYLTRSSDASLSLADRARFANRFPADQTLFISIHCNSHRDTDVHGLECYIFNLQSTDRLAETLATRENAEEIVHPIDFIVNNLYQRGSEKYSWEAAKIVQSSLVSRLKVRNRNQNAPDKLVRRAPFRVLFDTQMPAILVELGYLSNAKEYKSLVKPTYQQEVAEALFTAVQQFDQTTQLALRDASMKKRGE